MNPLVNQNVLDHIKQLPHEPGVYLFKDLNRQIIYIGKAKDLRNRVGQYVQRFDIDVKASSILSAAISLDHVQTSSELEALLLEAQLIQSHQPRFNVLLKDGQPFLWLTISSPSGDVLPKLELVRNKKKRGVYFGPFLEKGHARSVYEFLVRTFRLKICNKKIANGCLYYHLGSCAGACRPDFDVQGYRDRLALVQLALQKGRREFLQYLLDEIAAANKTLHFERSRELHQLCQSFERVFDALGSKKPDAATYVKKDIWVLSPDDQELFFYEERDTVLKKRQHFYFYPHDDRAALLESIKEYFLSVYRQRRPAHVILTNIDFGEDKELFQQFLQTLHNLELEPNIQQGYEAHYAQLLKMALVHMEQDRKKRQSLGILLKKLFLLPKEPVTIDCFDISHKQGTFMVGSCVRFTGGQPEPDKFRRFKIKTVIGQNDYASLREIVGRRYRDGVDLPDLILIDGGKGQLHAVDDLFPGAEFASLAKREETIFSPRIPEGKKLDLQSFTGQVLVALRDYTHHFAISYHRLLAGKITEE
jgi:excinuclease ABC subunit C